MKKIFTIIPIICIQLLHAQNPSIKQWDHKFGGTSKEFLSSLKQTLDGGYILGGYSSSPVSGNKSQSSWGTYDYWVVKVDSLGTKQWDADFGGTADDRLYSLQQTSDGGYILGGSSSSGATGNKTQLNWDSVNFTSDYWLVKIDSLGNMQWDKDFGGSENDYLYSVQQTSDGGYILGGSSSSDISGDKTESKWDPQGFTSDYWIIKVDSLGNKEWDKDLGGTDDDELASVQQTIDGGYLLAGLSFSGIGGDKTQESKGLMDYWIIKTDSLGNVQWDKDFGGSENDILYSMQYTSDRGFVLAGVSNSGISGDKSQPNWDNSNASNDYWIVKIDSLGIKQWDKVLGGTVGEPRLGSIVQTSDNGYLATGISYSGIGGNKTENNLGFEQIWVVKTDSIGTEQWDKTIFTTTEDESGYAIQTKSGCYLMANNTHSDIGGYVTESSWGFEDYWIVEFCDSSSIATSSDLFLTPDDRFSVYPNPFTNEITVAATNQHSEDISLEIRDLMGREVFKSSEESSASGLFTKEIETSSLSKGIYFVVLDVGGEKSISKIVKE